MKRTLLIVALASIQLAGVGAADTPATDPHDHWAYQPVQRPAVPKIKNAAWVRTPIDAFILAKLEAAGLTPNEPADKATLLRRATFDLIGLPPTTKELRDF